MKKRFIILIDFSEYSESLLKYAYDWSRQIETEFLIVHQTEVITPTLADIETREKFTQETNLKMLDKVKSFVENILPNQARLNYDVSDKNLNFTLKAHLNTGFEDLIFVGIKETSLRKKIFLGSTAIQLINEIENSFVAMPKEMTKFSHEKIFVAVTEKHPLNILELNNFLSFIDETETSITFFHLSELNEDTGLIEKKLRDLTTLFAPRYDANYEIYEKNTYFNNIKKVINNNIDELLIVQKGSRHLTDKIFRRFLINDLVFEGETPLIVLP